MPIEFGGRAESTKSDDEVGITSRKQPISHIHHQIRAKHGQGIPISFIFLSYQVDTVNSLDGGICLQTEMTT
jgi:hypothetical protein